MERETSLLDNFYNKEKYVLLKQKKFNLIKLCLLLVLPSLIFFSPLQANVSANTSLPEGIYLNDSSNPEYVKFSEFRFLKYSEKIKYVNQASKVRILLGGNSYLFLDVINGSSKYRPFDPSDFPYNYKGIDKEPNSGSFEIKEIY